MEVSNIRNYTSKSLKIKLNNAKHDIMLLINFIATLNTRPWDNSLGNHGVIWKVNLEFMIEAKCNVSQTCAPPSPRSIPRYKTVSTHKICLPV